MANKTSIEWTDFNWNFLRGCSRVSEGCRNCYAEGVAARFSGFSENGKQLPYFGLAEMVNGKPRWTGEISYHEDILLQPLRWTKPRKIFVNSMADLFHEKVTDEMLDKAFAVMALTPWHVYQILTKRPQRMRDYMNDPDTPIRIADQMIEITCGTKWETDMRAWTGLLQDEETNDSAIPLRVKWPLPNVWAGVSVEDQKTADERIPLLLDTPAAIMWISAEPLLGPIDLHPKASPGYAMLSRFYSPEGFDESGSQPVHDRQEKYFPRLDWIVVGGESGPRARPCNVEWVRSIVSQCKAADVPVFVKQLGTKPVDSTHKDIWGPNGAHHYCRPVGDPIIEEAVNTPGYTVTDQKLYRNLITDRKGGDISEWPSDLQVREYPNVTTAAATN